jgi:hypothetical protein
MASKREKVKDGERECRIEKLAYALFCLHQSIVSAWLDLTEIYFTLQEIETEVLFLWGKETNPYTIQVAIARNTLQNIKQLSHVQRSNESHRKEMEKIQGVYRYAMSRQGCYYAYW